MNKDSMRESYVKCYRYMRTIVRDFENKCMCPYMPDWLYPYPKAARSAALSSMKEQHQQRLVLFLLANFGCPFCGGHGENWYSEQTHNGCHHWNYEICLGCGGHGFVLEPVLMQVFTFSPKRQEVYRFWGKAWREQGFRFENVGGDPRQYLGQPSIFEAAKHE